MAFDMTRPAIIGLTDKQRVADPEQHTCDGCGRPMFVSGPEAEQSRQMLQAAGEREPYYLCPPCADPYLHEAAIGKRAAAGTPDSQRYFKDDQQRRRREHVERSIRSN